MSVKGNKAARMLDEQMRYFLNATSVLSNPDSGFRPSPEMRTAAQVFRHTWRTVKWFTDAILTDAGFNMDFEGDERETQKASSLDEERANMKAEFDRSIRLWGKLSEEELMAPLPDNPILGPVPKLEAISACVDHTAHHRGALTVYARLLGKVPPQPYTEPEAQQPA